MVSRQDKKSSGNLLAKSLLEPCKGPEQAGTKVVTLTAGTHGKGCFLALYGELQKGEPNNTEQHILRGPSEIKKKKLAF